MFSQAIMFLQSNFRKVSKNDGLESEISILKNIFLYTETIIPESTLNKTQANFLLLIKKEIIEEYKSLSIFNNEIKKFFISNERNKLASSDANKTNNAKSIL